MIFSVFDFYYYLTQVLDKDGVSAAMRLAEMATILKADHNMTLFDKLQDIYKMLVLLRF